MEVTEFLRVVTLRKGKLKPAEFRLREGEKGLSLFARVDQPSPERIIEAVREAGKQGELAVAVLAATAIGALGLRLAQTTGGTSVPEIDQIHYEVRLPRTRALFLRLIGVRLHEYFNEKFGPKLFAAARVLD